jgi:hypothetical protein
MEPTFGLVFTKIGKRIVKLINRWRRFSARQLVLKYTNNSIEKAVGALVEADSRKMTDTDFNRLSALIDNERKAKEG